MKVPTFLLKLWQKWKTEPKDLDKAIKSDRVIANISYLLALAAFVIGILLIVFFAIPIAQLIDTAQLTAYEKLSINCGLAIVVALPFSLAAWQYIQGMLYDQSALHYRVRKLERQLEEAKE